MVFTMAQRFRGYLPVVVDVETAGLNPKTDALLEIGAVILSVEDGKLVKRSSHFEHVMPFEGANIEPEAIKFLGGIDPFHPLRYALPEKEALTNIFQPIRQAIREEGCQRAILVGHNPFFDLSFLLACVERTGTKRNPFHNFATLDTGTMGALAYGQTVLARALSAAGIPFDIKEAHSAIYDAEKTAELFCKIVNETPMLIDPETLKKRAPRNIQDEDDY